MAHCHEPVQSPMINLNRTKRVFAYRCIRRKQIKLIRDVTFCSSIRLLSTNLLSFESTYETKFLFSSQGKRIVGATCSSDLAQKYLLSTAVNPANDHLWYYCKCYGHYADGTKSVQCTMHYWECPLT